jgi:hypothetical protein
MAGDGVLRSNILRVSRLCMVILVFEHITPLMVAFARSANPLNL